MVENRSIPKSYKDCTTFEEACDLCEKNIFTKLKQLLIKYGRLEATTELWDQREESKQQQDDDTYILESDTDRKWITKDENVDLNGTHQVVAEITDKKVTFNDKDNCNDVIVADALKLFDESIVTEEECDSPYGKLYHTQNSDYLVAHKVFDESPQRIRGCNIIENSGPPELKATHEDNHTAWDPGKRANSDGSKYEGNNAIVAALGEYRSLYKNKKVFIRYLISSNIGKPTYIFVATALGMYDHSLAIQLVFVTEIIRWKEIMNGYDNMCLGNKDMEKARPCFAGLYMVLFEYNRLLGHVMCVIALGDWLVQDEDEFKQKQHSVSRLVQMLHTDDLHKSSLETYDTCSSKGYNKKTSDFVPRSRHREEGTSTTINDEFQHFKQLNGDPIIVEVIIGLHKMDKSTIHDVVFVAVSTRIPNIQQPSYDFCIKKVSCKSSNHNEAVTCSATDQTSGIKTIISPRNTTISTKNEQVFSATFNIQLVKFIQVYECERMKTKDKMTCMFFKAVRRYDHSIAVQLVLLPELEEEYFEVEIGKLRYGVISTGLSILVSAEGYTVDTFVIMIENKVITSPAFVVTCRRESAPETFRGQYGADKKKMLRIDMQRSRAYSAIVAALSECRSIYNNIKPFISSYIDTLNAESSFTVMVVSVVAICWGYISIPEGKDVIKKLAILVAFWAKKLHGVQLVTCSLSSLRARTVFRSGECHSPTVVESILNNA